ncbi:MULTISPECIES: hypothetical protein [unclassified Aeromicrobium]|uniref:hypothetical protein n=1 Tax=unclassified Aeromicrobium TaxID=2633570 RepID=UPI002889772A|nr:MULTISPECIES: hypothetical protein [unclassified Aeromicrobium]
MPTRRHRRTGARDGHISAQLQRALLKEVHALSAVVDPADRVRAVNDFFAQLDAEMEPFAEVRLEAVAELRALGLSYDAVAESTGMSKARAAQLSRMARGVGGRRDGAG